MKTILVPIDFSDGSLAALQSADLLASQFGCRLTLLHVMARPGTGAAPDLSEADEMAERAWDGLADKPDLMQAIRTEMASFVAQAEPLRAERSLLYRAGPPATVILDTAERLGPRMIVMGSQGRTGLARFVVGSTAEAVVRGAAVPVLAVKPFAPLR